MLRSYSCLPLEITYVLHLDIGMYAQSFLLSLAARGIGSIPQTSVGMYADTIRQVLGVSDDMKLLFGVSFGYPDKEAKANSIRMGRDPIESNPM